MRRTAAALAIATFGLVTVVAPFADADVAPPSEQLHCGTVGPPVCDLIEQLDAQLAPVQPILALADPLVGRLSTGVHGLLVLSQSKQGVASADALDAVTDLQAALAIIPAPVRNLLGATALGQLQTTLDDLAAALAPVTEPVLGKPAATDGAKPTVMPAIPSSSTAAAAPTTADLDGTALDSGSTSSSDLPDVPNGDVLDLGPLALPDFGWTADVSDSAALDAAAPTQEEQTRLVTAAIDDGFGTHGASTGVVVILFSALLGGLALAAQWWQSRKALHTIPD